MDDEGYWIHQHLHLPSGWRSQACHPQAHGHQNRSLGDHSPWCRWGTWCKHLWPLFQELQLDQAGEAGGPEELGAQLKVNALLLSESESQETRFKKTGSRGQRSMTTIWHKMGKKYPSPTMIVMAHCLQGWQAPTEESNLSQVHKLLLEVRHRGNHTAPCKCALMATHRTSAFKPHYCRNPILLRSLVLLPLLPCPLNLLTHEIRLRIGKKPHIVMQSFRVQQWAFCKSKTPQD